MKFDYIDLKENHRQGEDKAYADTLNRIRVGNETEADIQILKEKVRNELHEDILKETDALFIYGTNKNVNKMNKKRLKDLTEEEIIVKAICLHRSIKNFDPAEGNAGEVNKTPFQKELRLKLGAKVMLTYNVDTCDGLTNGARGELIGYQKDSKNAITKLIVKFENDTVGQEKRRLNPNIAAKYPFGTPIEKVNFSFSISRSKKSIINTASVIQFPIKLAFACTAHKVQGLTVQKPQKVIINVEDAFAAAMVYVMLSRVCSLIQIYILNAFDEKKMHPNAKAMAELKRLESIDVKNNKETTDILKIYSLNCRSLRKHYEDIISDSEILQSDLICLQETWIEMDNDCKEYEIASHSLHPNNRGKGKGIVTFYKKDQFKHITDINEELMQLSKFSSTNQDVITIYRSQNCSYELLNKGINKLMTQKKPTLVVGDFNFCFKEHTTSTKKFFVRNNFNQLVNEPTHIGGHILDQAYWSDDCFNIECTAEVQGKYYSDHRGLMVTFKKKVDISYKLALIVKVLQEI